MTEQTFNPGDRVVSREPHAQNNNAPIKGEVARTVTLETGHQGLFIKDSNGKEWWLHASAVKML